ncbi:MAG: hypothetical protein RBS53_03065 [Bacteroidales bacterium]|jgi:hypothetical protein|nr:hypothetical protein [Bacteroidales bacterium]NLM92002.1 hypothetical protein [Bacteroidales bacterium]
MKSLKSSILLIFVMAGMIACQQDPGNLNSLKERMMANNYSGDYWQPSSRLEKMALNLIGVDDLLVYNDDNLNAFIFKVKDGKDPQQALDQLEQYVKDNITINTGSDGNKNEVSWEQIKEDAKVRGQYLLLWFGENEEDLLRVFRFF